MQFVRGTITKLNYCAYPEPEDIWDLMYWLQVPNVPTTIRVFDWDPISLDLNLEEGSEIECVLKPLLFNPMFLDRLDERADNARHDFWQGQIVSLEWRAPANGFRRTTPDLYLRGYGLSGTNRTIIYTRDDVPKDRYDSWVLVETHLGHLIMSLPDVQSLLKQTPRVGQTIFWRQDTRYDLYAIV